MKWKIFDRMLQKIDKVLRNSPGLKGREIAKKIGVDKSVVNSILYQHPQFFSCDENYCWISLNTLELKVRFENNKWIDCQRFEDALINAKLPSGINCLSITFIIPTGCKILLDASARLLSLCNQLVLQGNKVTVDFTDCETSFTYFDRLGFISQLHQEITILPERPSLSRSIIYQGNSQAVLEYGTVVPNSLNKEIVNQLTERFVYQSDQSYEVVAFTIFSELIGNIQEHSDTPIPGFAALQKYESKLKQKHIQTVISDSGKGIVATLSPSLQKFHPELFKSHKDEDFEIKVVSEVLTKGGISRFGEGRGLGFKVSREHAIKYSARLSVRQPSFSIDFRYKNGQLIDTKVHKGLIPILGTHLCFDFYVDQAS